VLLDLVEEQEGLVLDVAIRRSQLFLDFSHHFLHNFLGMASFPVQICERKKSSTLNVGAFVNERLFQKLLQTLDVLVVDDASQDPQGIGLVHFVLCLRHILHQAGYNHKHLVFVGFQFLPSQTMDPYLYKDVDKSPDGLVVALEQFCHVEEHC